MKETNLKKIRTACIEANPEIVELKRGCTVRYKNQGKKYERLAPHAVPTTTALVLSNGTNYIGAMIVFPFGNQNSRWVDSAICEIIGRPIHLADVLLAIEENTKIHWLNSVRPEETVSNHQEHLWRVAKDIIHKWNLRKDSLDDQSEETITFLASLL